tara:strand:- start:200 stop:784 length:585 start_codon:yes stop_codon:yes gene_type:complete
MYKVFFNQKPIFLITKVVAPTEENPLLFLKFTSKENIIKAIKSKKIKSVYLYHPKEDKLWSNLLKKFPLVQAAGGLVLNSNQEYLFIYRNNKWDLPKGKVEKNEKISDAAIREVEEETGVKNLKIVKTLPMTYHFFNSNGIFKLKKTFWYLMETDFKEKLSPQINEGIRKAVWKKKKELNTLFENAYENIKILF